MAMENEQDNHGNHSFENLAALHDSETAESLSEKALQFYVESIIKSYADKVEGNQNVLLDPIAENSQLTDTEIMMFVNKLLDMKGIDLFELQMFRSFCFS